MGDCLISDMELDTTMEKVVKQIYASCDTDNCDFVPASILIEFVTPYMCDNLSELNELKIKLDPNDTNPKISSKTFYEAMNDWTSALKENERENSFTESNLINNQLLLPLENFSSSTPRSSLGYYQIVKNCSGILNMSNASLFGSITNGTDSSNKTKFEDQINELQHKIKKVTQELELARNQLTLAEEQNESLLADFNTVTTNLQREQDLGEKLKREKQDVEGIKEENNLLQKKLCQLESELGNSKKEQHRLLTEIDQLENQKVDLESKLKNAQRNVQKTKEDLIEIKSLLGEKESEITTLKQMNEGLKCELNDKLEIISFYTNKVDCLKNTTYTLELKYKEKCFAYEQLSKSSESLNNSHNKSVGGKKQDVNFLKKVLTRPSSTPNQNEENLSNELLSPIEIRKSPPILYVVDRSKESMRIESLQNTQAAIPSDNQIITTGKSLKDELSECDEEQNYLNVENFNEIIRKKNEIIDELTIDLKEQQILCTELRLEIATELKNSKTLKQELDKILCKNTNDNESTEHEQLKSELSNCQNVNQTLVSSIETLKNELKEKQSKIINFNDFISRICEKLQEQFPCLGFLLHTENSFDKLEKLIDLIVKHQQSDTKNKKVDNFGKQQIKFEKLQEKNDIIQQDIAYLQKINKNLREENEQLKQNFQKYEKETKAMIKEQKILLEQCSREKREIKESFLEDLEFVKIEKQVQSEEDQEIISNLRTENNTLLKRIETLHNELIVGRAKNDEQHHEINMNLPLINQKGLLQQLNVTEKSYIETNRLELDVVEFQEKWSVFQYLISFFNWRKSNKMVNSNQKTNCLTNSCMKCIILILYFIAIIVIFSLIYVQFLCRMEGKDYVCPLDWILKYLVSFDVVATPII